MTPACYLLLLAERTNVVVDPYRRLRRVRWSESRGRRVSTIDRSPVGSVSLSSSATYSCSSLRSPDDLVCYGIVGKLALVLPFDLRYSSPHMPYYFDKGCRPSQSAIRPRVSLATSVHNGRQRGSECSETGCGPADPGGAFLWLQ